MAKVLEFDTFMQEAKGENITVRVGGKDYSVLPKFPGDCATDDGARGETG